MASTASLGGMSFAPETLAAATGRRKPAKSTILFFLCGGSSHIDMWDMKPEAPQEYRGPFRPIKTTAPGLDICEHLPLTAKQGKHLAIVRSVGDGGQATGDHHACLLYTSPSPRDRTRSRMPSSA